MRQRTLAALLALTAVAALVVVLPRTPPGRAWLLGRLTSALQRSGISLDFASSAGNPWTGIQLDGARLDAPGVQLRARSVKVHYFLPSLISGELPLAINLDGVRGSLDATRLTGGLTSGHGLPIRPRLQDLTVSDASITVQQVPYTIPSGAVSHVHIQQHGSSLDIQAQLSTVDGSADATGTLDLNGPTFDGQIIRADVALARHWFRGVTAGTVSGPIHAGSDGVSADLVLQGGALNAIGLRPHDVHGTVELRYPLIRADVEGQVLGGDVRAQGVVNIAARQWTAHAHGGPTLIAIADWLGRHSLASGTTLPLAGAATATIDASGWRSVHLAGSAGGSGAFVGLPLAGLQADFRYDSDAGVRVQATGRVAGGAAVVTVASVPHGTRIEATAKQLSPLPGQSVDVSAQLAFAASGATGTVHAVDHGTVLTRAVSLTLDAGLDSDGWQAAVRGSDQAGAVLDGAVALSRGRVSGELRARRLHLPGTAYPLSASLRADGPLSKLPLTLTLGGNQPVMLRAGPETLGADLSGTVSGTLAGRQLSGIRGTLGPLTVSGDLAVAPLAGAFTVNLASTPLEGPVHTGLSLSQGRLVIDGGRLTPGGILHVGSLQAGPARTAPQALELAAAPGKANVFVARGNSVNFDLDVVGRRLRATFTSLPAHVSTLAGTVDGSLEVPLRADALAGIAPDLTVTAREGTLRLQGRGTRIGAALAVPAGTGIGPFTLAGRLALTGNLNAVAPRAQLRGSLGALPLTASLSWAAGGPDVTMLAGATPRQMSLHLSPSGWDAQGRLDLTPLAAALGVPLQGTFAGALQAGIGGYAGNARIVVSAPVHASAGLSGAGSTLNVSATSTLLGQSVAVSGTLRPRLALSASAGPIGPFTLANGRFDGAGTTSAQALAPDITLRPAAWSLKGTLHPLSLRLRIGHGELGLDTVGGARLAGTANVPITYAGHDLTVRLATAGSGPPLSALDGPSVGLGGSLAHLPLSARLESASGASLANVTGVPAALRVDGTLPAGLVAAPLPTMLLPAGDVAVSGTASLTQGVRYHLDATWSAGDRSLQGSLSGTSSALTIHAQGAGLSVDVAPGSIRLTAASAELAPLFPSLPLAPVLDGTMALSHGEYSGTLRLQAGGPATLSATLVGHAGELRATGAGSMGPLGARASGTLLPTPDVHVSGNAWGGAATLAADVTGSWRAPTLTGTLSTTPLDRPPWLSVPARAVALRLSPGGDATATGDGVELHASASGLAGTLSVPFRALGVTERLEARVGGTIRSPSITGTISGAAVRGSVAGDLAGGLRTRLVVAADALRPVLPARLPAPATDVHLAATVDTAASWHATASTQLAGFSKRFPVDAVLDGSAASYGGTLRVDAPLTAAGGPRDTLAEASLKGNAERLRATVDLGKVDYESLGTLAGVPVDLHAGGQLDVATRPLSVHVNVDAKGEVAGRSLSVNAVVDQSIAVKLGYDGISMALTGSPGAPMNVAVRAPTAGVALDGTLAVGATPRLELTGTAAGAPLSAKLQADIATRGGSLDARLGGASLKAGVTARRGGAALDMTASVPPGGLAALGSSLGGSLTLEGRLANGRATVTAMRLSTAGGPTPVDVALSGPAYPRADLAGSLQAPGWATAGALSVSGAPSGAAVRLALGKLTVLARTHRLRLASVTADGQTSLRPGGLPVTVTARQLAWTSADGFEGSASLRASAALPRLSGALRAELAGHRTLSVQASAGSPGSPWATLSARLAARPTQAAAWQGSLTLAVPVARLTGLPSSVGLVLTGAPSVAGSLVNPSVDGPVRLSGAAAADGTLRWHAGHGRLTLSSSALALDASLTGTAWQASLALDKLPLAPFGAPVAGLDASLSADVQGGGGKPIEGNVPSLELTVPGASLSGKATLHDGIRAALQVQGDLAAMDLPGPSLKGLVHGPVVVALPSLGGIDNGSLIAVLDVAGLGTAGLDGGVDGTIQVGGSPRRPTLSATLQGSGGVSGRLRVAAAPFEHRLSLHSSLGYRGLTTNLDVSVQDGAVAASGSAGLGTAELRVSTAGDGTLEVRAAKGLSGWQATLAPSLASARLSGPLDVLGAGAHGQLTLTVGGTPWLTGKVQDAAFQGVALGDVRLSSTRPGAPVAIDSPHLSGSVEPTALSWQARLSALPLPGGATASGDASGRAATGSAVLGIGGVLAGKPVDLRVTASRSPGIALTANGTIFGGTLALDAERPSGSTWHGTAALTGAALAGIYGNVHGTISSADLGSPQLDAHAEIHGPVSGTAQVTASGSGVRVQASLAGDAIGGGVRVSGALAPDTDLTVASTSPSGPAAGSIRLYSGSGVLRGAGTLHLGAGPTRLSVKGGGSGGPIAIDLKVPAVPGLAFQAQLPAEAPLAVVRTLASRGLEATGLGSTRGRVSLQLRPTLEASLHTVALTVANAQVTADGTLAPAAATLGGTVTLPKSLPVDDLGGSTIPYQLSWHGSRVTLASDGPLGTLQATLDEAAGTGSIQASLHTLGAAPGTAHIAVAFQPGSGPSGTLDVSGIDVSRPGLPGLSLDANLKVGSGQVSGTADVTATHGSVQVSGSWGLGGWLPAALAPGASHGGNAEARVNTLDLASLPTVHRLAPHLSGNLSGVLRLRDETLVGQLVAPELEIAGTALPLDAQLSGPIGALEARMKLGSSVLTATLRSGEAQGLVQLDRFPAQVLAEASTGPTDISADVDGVLRFDVPYADPSASYLRMATQRVRLERAGVVTTGNLSWVYNDHALSILQADFKGRGSWTAQGSVDRSKLDLQLSAQSADFTPLLGLVPMFARYGVGASGSFTLQAAGSPANPDVTLQATGIEAQVAGTHYRLDHADAALKGDALTATAHVEGIGPLGGSVDVHGSARLKLAPLALTGTDFIFSGSAELPVVGTVTDLKGGIKQPPNEPPQLALSGVLGQPFSVDGSLAPFDVRVKGKGLTLRAHPLFITSSTVNADVRLRGTQAGLAIGGQLDATEVHMNIGAPSPGGGVSPPANASPQGSHPGGSGQQASTGAPSPAQSAAPATTTRAVRAARASVLFDDLHLKAPQRVLLDAGFGTAEAALDLTLNGTAAAPRLDGTARALRGTLTFAGRDFTIDQATATFQGSHGVYPSLDVRAHTTYDKQQVLTGAGDLSFTAPQDSSSFAVTLSFSGQVQPSPQGPNPVTFDIKPTLTSNAMVQTTTTAGATPPRPLSDSELLSLITLGKLEVKPQLAGQGAFGTVVAQSALDTAVDVLVVSELQNALSKALGLDVVEIRTTPLSSLLDNSGQPFGVSLRLGGYLTPELFASYRLGNFNGVGGAYGFTNEVSLSYDLGPLNFDLSGRLSFPEATPSVGAVPELGVGLRYAFTNNLGLEAGVDLSDLHKQARFGVSVYW